MKISGIYLRKREYRIHYICFMKSNTLWLPTSVKEIKERGWDAVDIILFSGDAYVDHPSFGIPVIGRVLEKQGYRVAIVPQPNWRDDLRDFRKIGEPRLFFGVGGGNMDSMVNHYTANRRLRSDDAYTAGGVSGNRPDRAATIYTNILKKLFPDVPVVLGGIEASLRRLTHYDYWDNAVHPSILESSGADILVYGMGERAITDIAAGIDKAFSDNNNERPCLNILKEEYLSVIPQTVMLYKGVGIQKLKDKNPGKTFGGDIKILPSHNECISDKKAFALHFRHIEEVSNLMLPPVLAEQGKSGFIVVNPPYNHLSVNNSLSADNSMSVDNPDYVYDLPFTRLPHPRYKDKRIPAYDMIKFSVNLHRGCFGGCGFCTISAHQGKFISSRSEESILREIDTLTKLPGFAGVISDLGGPSANMYRMYGKDSSVCEKCKKPSCLFPLPCKNLNTDHTPLINLYKKVTKHPQIKKVFIGSGIRYDLFLDKDGKPFSQSHRDYLYTVLRNHISGRLKVAPEHTEDHILKMIRKPGFSLFMALKKEFDRINTKEGLRLQLVPYFISSLPCCKMKDMESLHRKVSGMGLYPEQVQDFTPTPMTLATAIFYSGLNPYTLEPVFTEFNPENKQRQKSLFFKAPKLVQKKVHGQKKRFD